MSGSRSRSILYLAGILLAALLASLLWIAVPNRDATVTNRAVLETASSPSLEASPDSTPRPAHIEGSPREAVPVTESAPSARSEDSRVPGRIEGRVLRRDGSPAAAGTLVIGRAPNDPHGDAEIAERIARRDPTILSARTDADGGFVFAGLAPGSCYMLAAAGSGAISTQWTPAILQGTAGVRIDASLIYGIAVELREADGAPLASEYGPPEQQYGRGPDPLLRGNPLLDLVGVDLSQYRGRPHTRLFLYTSPREVEPPNLGPMSLRFQFMGYSPVHVAYDALPILPAIPQHVVEFRSIASGWGEIVVEFADARDPTPDGPRTQPFRLQLRSSTGPPTEIPLPREVGPKRLPGIPSTRYRVTVLNALAQQVYPRDGVPAPPLDVGTAPVTLAVPLAGTSELEIQVRGSADRRYEGRASFALARGELTSDGRSLVGPTVSVTFDRAPYILGALLPGHYAMFVQEPAGAVVLPADSNGLFDLDAGGAKTVTLSLP